MERRVFEFIKHHGVRLSRENIISADVLPHRGIALDIVDGVIDFNDTVGGAETLTAVKLLKPEDFVFAGHFPGKPVCPGHWLLEMGALTVALLYFCLYGKNEGRPALVKVSELTFRHPATPGSVIFIKASAPNRTSRSFAAAVNITNADNKTIMTAGSLMGLLLK